MINLWQMARATKVEKARHLNAARGLLQSQLARVAAVRQLASELDLSVRCDHFARRHAHCVSFSRPHLYAQAGSTERHRALRHTRRDQSVLFPDGQWIGFFAIGKMRKISVEGGTEVALCDAGGSYTGADWGEDGNIVASLSPRTGLPSAFRSQSLGDDKHPLTQLIPSLPRSKQGTNGSYSAVLG